MQVAQTPKMRLVHLDIGVQSKYKLLLSKNSLKNNEFSGLKVKRIYITPKNEQKHLILCKLLFAFDKFRFLRPLSLAKSDAYYKKIDT